MPRRAARVQNANEEAACTPELLGKVPEPWTLLESDEWVQRECFTLYFKSIPQFFYLVRPDIDKYLSQVLIVIFLKV